jgi:AmmeMemoRadiSam system protein B
LIVQGAIVPHAPLLTGLGDRREGHLAGRVVGAIRRLRFTEADVLAVLSPHGRFTGLYSSGVASLRGFGTRTPGFEVTIDAALTAGLAEAWPASVEEDALDHGVVVPLSLLHTGLPVVAATLREDDDATAVIEYGRSFASCLSSSPARIAFVASANTSAALGERAPLGLREGAREVDERVIGHLTTGAGDGSALLQELAGLGGSCGAGPLAAFAEAFAGKAVVHAYEAPVGVGYLVATAGP